MNNNNKNSDKHLRIYIGKLLRELRKKRGLSQAELGEALGLPQSTLSEIELGKASLATEYFLGVLRFFNVTANHFDPTPAESPRAIQKALAHHGASHLIEDPTLLPSEALGQVDTAIREALVSGDSARAITALAPVFIRHIGQINLTKLYVQFHDYSLESRFCWLLDNTREAIHLVLPEFDSRRTKNSLSRAESVLSDYLNKFKHLNESRRAGQSNSDNQSSNFASSILFEDHLGTPLISEKSRNEIRESLSKPSRRWNILTTITVEDFANAIREVYASNPH